MRRRPESLGAIVAKKPTISGSSLLLALVLSLVSCDAITITKTKKEGEGDDLSYKFIGYKISYENEAGSHLDKVYDIESSQLVCLPKGNYIELFAKVN